MVFLVRFLTCRAGIVTKIKGKLGEKFRLWGKFNG